MSTSQIIQQNAHIQAQILASIDDLDYVLPALHLHMSHFNEVCAQNSQSESRLLSLSAISREKHMKLIKIQKASAQRLAYKLVGKKRNFAEKELKRKREYQEAVGQEMVQMENHRVISQQLADAHSVKTDLEEKARKLQSYKDDLGRLYWSIFDGPTPEFPEEDRLEHHLQTSQTLHDKLQHTWEAESQIDDILAAADQKIGYCKAKMEEALSWYRRGFSTDEGSTIGGIHGRTALSEAQSFAAQADTLCQQARNMSPFVHPIEELYPAQKDLTASLAFVRISFSDSRSSSINQNGHGPSMIRNALTNANRVHDQLKGQMSASRHRTVATYSQLSDVSRILEESRRTLFHFRHSTFQRIVSEMEHVSG